MQIKSIVDWIQKILNSINRQLERLELDFNEKDDKFALECDED